MDHFSDVATSFLERCQSHQSLEALIADFAIVLGHFGFTRFMMTRLPTINTDPEPLILAHSWSKEWGDRYRSQNYFWADPVSRFSLAHHRPFTWVEARAGSPDTRVARQIASEATNVGMVDGLGFPLADPTSVQSVVSLSSDKTVDLPHSARGLLHMVCIYCEMHAVELTKAADRQGHLTPKEKEILQWMAAGKSRWETSRILSVSDRTVETHLKNASQRLGTSSTTQTIALALYSRLIHL